MPAVTKDGIPFLDLGAEFARLEREWFDSLRETGARGSFILGPNVQAFENEFADYLGVHHAVGLANGTDALLLGLRALGVGPGDEVVTTPYTFFATTEVISLLGATPVFVDIDPHSFNMDPDLIGAAVTAKTKAILPVHLFGHPADMDAINAIAQEHGIAVIEDCAQACGARWKGKPAGSFGDCAAFSFYPTKVLGCYGDGGMLITSDEEVADQVRRLRNHGATSHFMHDQIGYNSRLDEIQASLLRIKFQHLGDVIAARQRIANAYDKRLRGSRVITPTQAEQSGHAFNLYTVRLPDRDAARQRFVEHKIGHSLCYPLPLHLQAVYKDLGYEAGSLPVSEQASRECISLPVYPDMPDEHIDRVCEILLGE